jgi:hypothetical protein
MKNIFEQKDSDKGVSADFIRHSQSGYKTYAEQLKNNPTDSFDKYQQITPDLTESGIELAKKTAQEYFKALDPNNSALFFVSSNESRAIETANIYREIAKEMGFEIITPQNTRSKISDKIADGQVRILDTLSLNLPNLLANSVFSPAKYRTEINFEYVSEEEKERFEKAKAIIDADDQGSYAKNYDKYSEQIKKIFPEIKSAHDLRVHEFENMKKLLKFAAIKTHKSGIEKNIKIIAVGHENILSEALREMFEEDGINNCEVLNMELDRDGLITGEFRGKKNIV